MRFSQVDESIWQTPKGILTGMGRMARIKTKFQGGSDFNPVSPASPAYPCEYNWFGVLSKDPLYALSDSRERSERAGESLKDLITLSRRERRETRQGSFNREIQDM